MSSIRFDAVGKSFGNAVNVLEGINLDVADKEFLAIVGPSGCGKTTCLRLAAGFEFPTSGRVLVGNSVVTRPGPDRAVVFQQFALFPWKTVAENIELGLRNKGVAKEERRTRVADAVGMIGLGGYEEAYPHQLSGGMQQRVAIARAYVLDPQVLLMDEPFGALDAQTRVVMQEELVRLARRNPRTVLFITHGVEEAVYLADRVAIMSKRPGRIKEIIDVKSVRLADNWERHSRIEDVMDLESFVHLRTHIWKSLREEKAGTGH
ncbi:MAG TPA: ABC transporter ATP-binding protein [Xanthobacteraceae bacterium]|jgi:NitT/TauT family transport system ATP-binding protein|uniref:ABC transporter ATP-binding protein n=1 Tax=Roseixanthobacter finlandensis TaxID=3119922 RepID=UPI000BC7CEE8|nr:MAG: ABC transporter ATP-binding protein [Rhizobiales bacterium 12-66-7]OYY81055.1 MAG: ABC transporter ATP-binding protein [Rhizobiales bacterium 35-66-30]HQS09685.1 ABC transporter ATP-binding protein [Xanthobacteraceae bacterium]HQS49378.1 ABC transporter ATP-binding protein [Xanthobacteraceae bacterium]